MLYFASPRESINFKQIKHINVTSHSTDKFRALSPFLLGPVELYGNYISKNMENGWQFCKVYSEHADALGNPTARYFSWSRAGWSSERAFRYPMGKGTKPLYSYWNGRKLDYIAARKEIYIPLYSKAAAKTKEFKELQELYKKEDLLIVDFDVYDRGVLDWDSIIACESRKMGHGFVLGMMIDGFV